MIYSEESFECSFCHLGFTTVIARRNHEAEFHKPWTGRYKRRILALENKRHYNIQSTKRNLKIA